MRWRKIQKLGLATTYKDSKSEKGKWLKYFFGLTYLNPDNVEEMYCELVSMQPSDVKLSAFADYILETYVDPETAVFPPQIWACDASHLWRTTNACESFHSRFNASCVSNHPNIFVFLSSLFQTQTDVYIRINSAEQGQSLKSDKKTREKVLFIDNKLRQFETKDIDLVTFVKCISMKVSV